MTKVGKLALFGAAIMMLSSSGAFAATGTGTSRAKMIKQLTITAIDEMSFGRFAPDGSGNTIVDMAMDGSTSCMGASVCSSAGTPGTFSVTGSPNQIVHISMAGNFFLYNGTDSVEVGNIVFSGTNVAVLSYFQSNGLLDSAGALDFKITGSLWMTAGTPDGDFSGSYTVNVDYQ